MKNSELIDLLQNLNPDANVLDGEERDITQVLDWVGNTIMIESDYKKYVVAKLSFEQEKEVNDAWDNFQKMREKQLTEQDDLLIDILTGKRNRKIMYNPNQYIRGCHEMVSGHDKKIRNQVKEDIEYIKRLKEETNGTYVTGLDAGEMKPNETSTIYYDEIKPQGKKYTESEMFMALAYQRVSPTDVTIEQVDKMLNDLGTNE